MQQANPIKKYLLQPLHKHSIVPNHERLAWLRQKFHALSRKRQRQLFPFLKTDLQNSLLAKGYEQ